MPKPLNDTVTGTGLLGSATSRSCTSTHIVSRVDKTKGRPFRTKSQLLVPGLTGSAAATFLLPQMGSGKKSGFM